MTSTSIEKPSQTLSVILINYNHARFLPESIQSLLDQTYQPTEFIIIDDGSTDNSVEVIQGFAQEHSVIKFFQNDGNKGVIYSLNRGLELASCDYVAIASADDIYLPRRFERTVELLQQHPRAALCSGLTLMVDPDGGNQRLFFGPIISRSACFLSPDEVRGALCTYGNWMITGCATFRREALLEAGGFRPELHSFFDGFLVQVLALTHGACFVPEPFLVWRRMEEGYSSATNTNPERVLESIDNVEQLMRTTYSALFPPDYIDAWKKLQFYWIGDALQRRLRAHQHIFLEDIKRIYEPRGLVGKGFYLLLKFSLAGQALLATAYFMLRGVTLPAIRAVWNNLLYRRTGSWRELGD